MTEADLFDPVSGRFGGALMCKGTAVPVSVLFETLIAGTSVDRFVETYSTVQLEQAKATIIWAGSGFVEYRHAQRL
ncbi:DUF433 domain-containing protein [Aureimonas sp. Leaf454]|uniref:DUF433 domain-containing protein n=1 Tax=Aureimonas sp. Leaf454 TaxID=1736381 RepID=UPI00138F8740|nr:DUF433 domain-containing protein [Aureimonas sp. Leaf454]